jgi:hypothetical protein
MFWGCFNGIEQGPGLFWEKEWDSINQISYCQHIVSRYSFPSSSKYINLILWKVPLIHGWLTIRSNLYFMQDGAPGHRAKATKQDLEERGIQKKRIFWPAYSPDLNPIETV